MGQIAHLLRLSPKNLFSKNFYQRAKSYLKQKTKGIPVCGHQFVNNADYSKELLEVNQSRLQPTQENSFHFYNKPEDWENFAKKQIGYCRGFAIVGSSFSQRSVFASELSSEQLNYLAHTQRFSYLKELPEKGSEAWDKLINRLTQEIVDGEVRIIPGYKNLYELSQAHETQLRILVLEAWAKYTTSLDTFHMVRQMYREITPQYAENFVTFMKTRLQAGHNSLIYFSLDPSNTPEEKKFLMKKLSPNVIHVVEAIGLEEIEHGFYRLKIWDRNFPAEENPKSLYINTETGHTFYPQWGKEYPYAKGYLSDIGIPVENEFHHAQTLDSWGAFRLEFPNIYKELVQKRKL